MWCFCSEWNCFFSWLDKWQTLISGIIAVGAAGISIGFLRRQIEGDDRRHSADRRTKLLSLRAKMPLSLDEVGSYAREATRWMWNPILPAVSPTTSPPPLPMEAIRELADIIEFADENSARVLARLLQRCQISKARLEEYGGSDLERDGHIIDCIEIRWLANASYKFARLEVDAITLVIDPHSLRIALDECAGDASLYWPDEVAELGDRLIPRAERLFIQKAELLSGNQTSMLP